MADNVARPAQHGETDEEYAKQLQEEEEHLAAAKDCLNQAAKVDGGSAIAGMAAPGQPSTAATRHKTLGLGLTPSAASLRA